LNGGSAGQGGIAEVLPPAAAPALPVVPPPALPDLEPLRVP